MRSVIGVVAAGLLAGSALAGETKSAPMMELMDADRDGKVTAEEHTAGAKKMFEMMDADHDGLVTAQEMTAAQEKFHASTPPKDALSSEEKIAAVDADRDGKVSLAEHDEASLFMFEKMDANRDGFLAQREITAGHAQVGKRQARSKAHKRP